MSKYKIITTFILHTPGFFIKIPTNIFSFFKFSARLFFPIMQFGSLYVHCFWRDRIKSPCFPPAAFFTGKHVVWWLKSHTREFLSTHLTEQLYPTWLTCRESSNYGRTQRWDRQTAKCSSAHVSTYLSEARASLYFVILLKTGIQGFGISSN